MAKDYRPVDRDQAFLLPPSMSDWLAEDHLVWFVIEAVRQLDTTALHSRARLGRAGRRGYDPDMLLTLWIYAMAHGQRSSRQIERLCATDVAFRVICAGDVPDHTVLAVFRKVHEAALADRGLWANVLKNVRAGLMPPAGESTLSAEEVAALADWVKRGALGLDPADPDPGRVTLRRLNRAEYANTIRDLMGVEFLADVMKVAVGS